MKKVLLVNDSKFESRIMKDMLVSIGYDVTVTDEFQAMEQALTGSPEFIISNYTMKEIRGDELIHKIKEKNPHQKCILSSNNPINTKDFSTGKIDYVFQTPISKTKLEEIFDMLSVKIEASHNTVQGKFCPACGNLLQGDSGLVVRFCAYCGYQF